MSTETTRTQERTDSADDAPDAADTGRRVTGPHDGYDRDGRLDHRYWRCERCGLEATDPRLREGCFRCGGDGERGDRDAE